MQLTTVFAIDSMLLFCTEPKDWLLSVVSSQCTVQVKLELGHRAQLRKKVTTEGFTHDWMVFVRGPETCDIQHFVERVVFRLHDSFPKPKRGRWFCVCTYISFTVTLYFVQPFNTVYIVGVCQVWEVFFFSHLRWCHALY